MIIQDVLKAISLKQNWDLEDVKVSKLDLRKVRFGSASRVEFRVGFGKSKWVIKRSEDEEQEVGSWKKFKNEKSDFGSLVTEIGSLMGVLNTFKMEGPFELLVGGDHQLSLLLPVCFLFELIKVTVFFFNLKKKISSDLLVMGVKFECVGLDYDQICYYIDVGYEY